MDSTETIDHLDICDVFNGFGSPALLREHEIPAERRHEILRAEGLPQKVAIAVAYDRSFPGVGNGERREGIDEDRCASLPGWFALLDCGAVVQERFYRQDNGEYDEDAEPEFRPIFLPWQEIQWLHYDRDWEGYLTISGHEIDTSPLSSLQTEILYHGIRYLVSRVTGEGFSYGQRRCTRVKEERPKGLLPIDNYGFAIERVAPCCSEDYIRFRARQMGLGPELWTDNL
jgi:hypothetical protein